MTVPGAPRSEPPAGDPAARGRFGLSVLFRRTPGHIGRARTSTLVLAALFVGLGVLYLYVRPEASADPAGGTTQVSTPAPAPATTTEVPPATEPEQTTPEETSAPTTTGPETTTEPTTTLPTGTTPPTPPTGTRTTEPQETEPGEPAPTSEAPAPTTGGTPPG